MNHIYRIVWSRVRNAFMVVAENISSNGRGASGTGRGPVGTLGVFVLSALGAAIFVEHAHAAGVEVASGNTQVFQAPNGVQVIDIATANKAGVSHNRYIQYNVDPGGQILNNNSALTRAGALQSQLGGQIVPNVNLTNEARVILNEVVAPNRSSLRGYTEVVGGKADVIVANPYGITCSGCGFINTDRATLTTGVPTIGGDGRVAGFNVKQGDILIEGNGIDGRNQKVLDLVARSVKIDGQVNGQDVAVVAGSNTYGYADRSTTATAPSGDTPLYAIDSTALGGMYANRIQLLATENGVGVRMRGEAAASADDFMLSASGKIEINTRISAERDIALKSSTAGEAIRVEGDGTQLSASRDIAISAQNGQVILDETTLTASRDLTLVAASLRDNSEGDKRYAGRDARIETTGITQVTGSAWGAGDDLSIRAASLTVDATANLYSGADAQGTGKSLTLTTTTGDLRLNQATVQSAGKLKLDSAALLATGSSTEIKSAGDFDVKATGAIDHAGKLLGAADGKVKAGDRLTNSNVLHVGGDLTVDANSINNTNTAGLSSLKELSLEATTSIDNSGALYAGEHLSLKAGDKVQNHSSGTVDSNGSMATDSARFINNGAVVGVGDIHIKASQSFVNETIWGGGALTKKDGTPSYGDIVSEDKIANSGFLGGIDAWLTDQQFEYDEELVGLSMAQLQTLQKAQIIANGADSKLTIDYGSSGLNRVGVISAPIVEIRGAGTFTNEELALYRYTKVLRWITRESRGDAWVRIDPERFCYDGGPASCVGRDDNLPNSPDNDDIGWGSWSPGAGWINVSYDERLSSAVEGGVLSGATVIARSGAGIFATSLTFEGGTLENLGSPWPDDESLVRLGNQLGVSVTTPGVGAPNITLPSNPNGYFVPSKNPSSRYLVETNPIFSVGSNFVGSDYLAERYGFNPDTVQTRLGDANYEGYLVRQQLIQLTGNNVIAGYDNEADQMKRLMDQAYAQGQALGLEFGKAPSAEQLAALSEDIVWMEETVVNGQTVLAPKVYLAASTVASLDTGAVIAARDTRIDGEGLSNTGGTISGSGSLTVNTTGDITNTSGTIKGGNVSLTSSEGSIRNETLAIGAGDGTTYTTAIGKTGRIESTGDLNLDAARNVEVIGADVSAKGNAMLNAGGDIVVDTIVDKSTSTSYSESRGLIGSSSTRTTVGSETNIGSKLDIGGNLGTRSGGDTTIAGSQVDVGGDLDAQADGSFNVVARQDKQTVETQSTKSGLGVGGGLYGSQKTTVNDFTGTNAGSTLNVGGNAKVNAGEQIVLQGSDVNIGGDASLEGKEGIAVLDGLDERRTSTVVETTTFMKLDGSSGASAGADASADLLGGASASAQAEARASGNLKLMETSRTVTNSGSNTSVASNLNVGGNLDMRSDGAVTVQGSSVSAGGDLGLEAREINVLTGRDESWSESDTTRTSLGIYTDSKASAGASAGASAHGSGGAKANAKAETTATAGMRNEHEQSSSYDLVNRASSLKSGGDMNLRASETATFQGAQVASGGDMNIEAQDIRNVAAQDISTRSSSAETHTAGLYVGASAETSASAGVDASGQAKAQAGASVEASAGLRQATEQTNSSSTAITQVTNSFTSGGNFNRSAQNTIVDQGTQVEAGGNISQSAREIRDEAVSNQTYSDGSSYSHDARVGAYVGAEAKASTDGDASAGAGYGAKASVEGAQKSSVAQSSTAVTSGFKAGGSISSISTEQTTLVGTRFEAGENVDIQAGSLDIQAARDTRSGSSSSQSLDAEVKVGTDGGNLKTGFDSKAAEQESSTARTANIAAGGSLNIRTSGNARFEGTELSSGGDTRIDAGGDVEFAAARDTSSSSSSNLSLSVSASQDDEGAQSGSASAGGGLSRSDSSQARTGSISSGGNVSVTSGGNTTLEGTQVQSAGDTSLAAGGQVRLDSADSSSSSIGVQAGVSAQASKNKDGEEKGGSAAGASVIGGSRQGSSAATIRSAGETRIEQGR
ncbi:hemagglutinin repeat-containing protein [Stutzerimonas nitrititolerans]|uniref:hemagglutinin repeat-containing protein n=1 Tax=Stutzerimonas nitrititolerans TaxID=2482751 RepID=UPI0028B1F98F|nr:hemagglutinin repeat-containing protein [Stutzerimonas nitrititolerans]